MSNCIEIMEGKKITFQPGDFDTERYEGLLKEAAKLDVLKAITDSTDSALRCAWWYLERNSRFQEDGSVEIVLGEGRSKHTWRDFEWVLETLRPYVKRPFTQAVRIYDEMDNFEVGENFALDLKNGKIKRNK